MQPYLAFLWRAACAVAPFVAAVALLACALLALLTVAGVATVQVRW